MCHFRYLPIAVILVAALSGCSALSGDAVEQPTPTVTETPTSTETPTETNTSESSEETTPDVSNLDNAPGPSTATRTPAPPDASTQEESDVETDTPTPTATETPETVRVDDPEFDVEVDGPWSHDEHYGIEIEVSNPHECDLTAQMSAVAMFPDDPETGMPRQEEMIDEDRERQTIESGESVRLEGVRYDGPNEVVDHDVDVEVVDPGAQIEGYVECER